MQVVTHPKTMQLIFATTFLAYQCHHFPIMVTCDKFMIKTAKNKPLNGKKYLCNTHLDIPSALSEYWIPAITICVIYKLHSADKTMKQKRLNYFARQLSTQSVRYCLCRVQTQTLRPLMIQLYIAANFIAEYRPNVCPIHLDRNSWRDYNWIQCDTDCFTKIDKPNTPAQNQYNHLLDDESGALYRRAALILCGKHAHFNKTTKRISGELTKICHEC